MTVEATTSRVQYATNATTGPFTVAFYFLADSDLEVVYTDANGTETVLTLTTDYSVTGAGDPAGGTITTVTAYASGGTLTILRDIDPLQETDYTETDSFPAASHERALDKLTMLVQQLKEVTDRSLVFAPSDEVGSQLPAVAIRASKLLAFDSLGRVSMSVPADGSAASLALLLAGSSTLSEGAAIVGYDPSLAYTGGTVGGKLNQHRTFLDAGAVGDGVTDDTVAVQYAITHYGGEVIDGGGLTYLCTAPITGWTSGTVIRNANFDFSTMPDQGAGTDKCFAVNGTVGTAVALTANLAADAVTVSVGSTATFAAEKWVRLASSAVWSTIDGSTYGQYAKVKSVDSGTQLTLYAGPFLPYNTASTATIAPVTMVERVRFEAVTMKGAQANSQVGIYYDAALDCSDEGCTLTDFDYAAVAMSRSVNCRGSATAKRIKGAGNAYGYMIIHGSYGCAVMGGYGEDLRHYVTVGGTLGINLYCKANYNVVYGSRSAGIDSHVASYGFEAIGNQITLANGYGDEGLTIQGLNWKMNDNHIYGVTGVGAYGQPLATNGSLNRGMMRGNHIHFPANVVGTPIGLYALCNPSNGSDWSSCDIDGNHFYGGNGCTGLIHVYVNCNKASGTIKDVTIRANVSTDAAVDESIFIRALGAGALVDNVIIDSNVARSTGARPIRILCDGAASQVAEVVMTGNVIKGGSTANVTIDASAGTIATMIESDNIYSGSSTKFETAGTITGLRLRTCEDVAPTTTTGSSATVSSATNSYISNRAGTITYTLPLATKYPGRQLRFRTLQAQTSVSASANIVPIDGSAASTAILPGTAGKWAVVESDGTNWNIVAAG